MAGKRKPSQHPPNDHVDGIDTLSHERFNRAVGAVINRDFTAWVAVKNRPTVLSWQTSLSKSQFAKAGIFLWPSAFGPEKFPIRFMNRQIVDAGKTPPHQTGFIELPVFVAIGAEPVVGIIMPLIGKPDGNSMTVESPQFFDKPVVQFPDPFAG